MMRFKKKAMNLEIKFFISLEQVSFNEFEKYINQNYPNIDFQRTII